jgi:hypothetical protein
MNDDVGYRRPPKHTQFKPGQSGNPRGRKRGVPNVRAEIEAELAELMPLRRGEQQVAVSKARILVKSVVAAALNGNMSAAKLLFDLYLKFHASKVEAPELVSASDRDLVKKFLDAELQKRNPQLADKE